MKKFIVFLSALMLMSVLTVPAFAATYGKDDTVEIDVFGKTQRASESVYSAEDSGDGNYTVKSGDGIKVSVNSPEQKGMSLIVRVVKSTDKEAYEWFLECTDGYGTDPTVFDIYFSNENGERIELDESAKIEIALNKAYTRLKLFVIDMEGNVTELDRKINGATISFDASRNGYYVFLEGRPDPSQPPATGDVGILLFVTLVLASACSIVAVAGKRKNRT